MTEDYITPKLSDVDALLDGEPYLHLKLTNGGIKISGAPEIRLGQVQLPETVRTGQEVYAEWRWDGKEVVVKNCRLGYFPIYYYATDKEFGVSPSIERLLLLGAPADFNDAAIAVYLRLGWMVGEDTPFRNIHGLPPDGMVKWSAGKSYVSGGFVHPKPLSISHDEAVDAFAYLARQAIRRRIVRNVPFVMPLSGGRDSRNILLELNEQKCKPQVCITNHDYPPYRTQNIEIARELAKRLNVPHLALGQPKSRFDSELHKNRLNDYCAHENIWCVSLYAEIGRRYGKPLIYEGGPGGGFVGEYSRQELNELLNQKNLNDVAHRILNRWLNWQSSEDALQRAFTQEANKRFSYDLAIHRLRTELERHQSAANPVFSFYFLNRGRRVSALEPFSIARRHGVMPITPFLDHDFVEFAFALPPAIHVDKPFHVSAIHKLYPAYKDIPFAGDVPIPPIENNSLYRRFLIRSVMYLMTHGTGQFVQRHRLIKTLTSLALSSGNLRIRMRWVTPYSVLYLTQLEALMNRNSR